MSAEEGDIESLSRHLGERLGQGDPEALKEIFDQFASAVTSRLRARFGRVLDASDLDDVVSQALLRCGPIGIVTIPIELRCIPGFT